MGTIGILVPLSMPLFETGSLDPTGMLTAMAISAAVSDISPYSTWGALFIATAAQSLEKAPIFKAQLTYTVGILLLGPLAAWWLFVVLPG